MARPFIGPSFYTFDPQTGLISHVNPDGSEHTVRLEDLTDGTRSLSGRAIRDTETGRFRGSFPASVPSTLEKAEDNILYRLHPIPFSEANTASDNSARTRGGASFQMAFPNGEVLDTQEFIFDVHPVGHVLVERPQPGGGWITDHVPWQQVSHIAGTVEGHPGWRIMSPEDAVSRAIEGVLMRRYRTELEAIRLRGVFDETGHLIMTTYDLAAYIARTGFGAVELGILVAV